MSAGGCELVALMGDAASAAACYDASITNTGIVASLVFLLALVGWATWQQSIRRNARD